MNFYECCDLTKKVYLALYIHFKTERDIKVVGISLHTTKEIKVEPIWNWSQHKYIHTFSFAPNMADNSSHSSIISLQYAHINGVSGE